MAASYNIDEYGAISSWDLKTNPVYQNADESWLRTNRPGFVVTVKIGPNLTATLHAWGARWLAANAYGPIERWDYSGYYVDSIHGYGATYTKSEDCRIISYTFLKPPSDMSVAYKINSYAEYEQIASEYKVTVSGLSITYCYESGYNYDGTTGDFPTRIIDGNSTTIIYTPFNFSSYFMTKRPKDEDIIVQMPNLVTEFHNIMILGNPVIIDDLPSSLTLIDAGAHYTFKYINSSVTFPPNLRSIKAEIFWNVTEVDFNNNQYLHYDSFVDGYKTSGYPVFYHVFGLHLPGSQPQYKPITVIDCPYDMTIQRSDGLLPWYSTNSIEVFGWDREPTFVRPRPEHDAPKYVCYDRVHGTQEFKLYTTPQGSYNRVFNVNIDGQDTTLYLPMVPMSDTVNGGDRVQFVPNVGSMRFKK